jgi:DUF4097 and DUF4098 domain-containing protein YvlB
MILRFALIALLVSSAAAHAEAGGGARASRAPQVPARPAPVARPHGSAPADVDERESTDTTLSVPARGRLELDNFSGEILVSAWDRSAMRVQAEHAPRRRVQVDVRPATVTLRTVRRIRIHDPDNLRHARIEEIEIPSRVDYRLTVPRWMSLRLSGVNSRISVEGVEGDVGAEAVTGPVSVRGGRGTIRVNSVNGAVEVIGVRGSVEAGSVSEGVTLRDVEGRVRVESVSGDVDLERIVSDAVEASTVSGDLSYSGTLSPGGSYRFESHSGDLTVVMPERPDVAVLVNTYSGEFRSSLPVQSKSTFTSVRGLGKEFDFTLGDGRAELSLESFSGLIRLASAGEPAGRQRVIEVRRDK